MKSLLLSGKVKTDVGGQVLDIYNQSVLQGISTTIKTTIDTSNMTFVTIMNKEIIHTNADRLVGMIAIVTKKIANNEIGEVKVENASWRAISIDGVDIEVGEKVIINSLSGNKVVVSSVNNTNDVEFL